MEFPVTIESQDDFDQLVKGRLNREKTKQADMQTQIDTLTAEKQAFETKASELETRATTAETTLADYEATTARAKLTNDIAKEFGLTADVLRGSNEEELRAHAELLKPLISPPLGPGKVPDLSKTPTNEPNESPEHQLARSLFGKD